MSRVEGRGFHVEGEGTMSRVEGNIFFPIFFFLEKVIIDAINVIKANKKNLKNKYRKRIEKSSGTSQFVVEELHL